MSQVTKHCRVCGTASRLIIEHLGVCARCIHDRFAEARPHIEAAHIESRRAFGLPGVPPRAAEGVTCPLCAQGCAIGPGERGYCGLRTYQAVSGKRGGRLRHLAGLPARGVLHWYRDRLPTNCVADWVCAGSSRYGYHNLAVFYASCTLNCLYCQNWRFRETDPATGEGWTAQELADCANERTYCVCYFGGDPSSQMPHALASARLLAARGGAVCWETAGLQHPKLMDRAVQLSLESGGTVKFDLKAFDEGLHVALTGSSNRRTLDNFRRAAEHFPERPDPPMVIASTLLVPGYVTPEEVGRIARLIAGIDPRIPYSLLGFAPQFYVPDLPRTSVRHADAALEAARAAGLTRVHVGNRQLLSREY
jgi:pyruvate formate lyase activating enzyme